MRFRVRHLWLVALAVLGGGAVGPLPRADAARLPGTCGAAVTLFCADPAWPDQTTGAGPPGPIPSTPFADARARRP